MTGAALSITGLIPLGGSGEKHYVTVEDRELAVLARQGAEAAQESVEATRAVIVDAEASTLEYRNQASAAAGTAAGDAVALVGVELAGSVTAAAGSATYAADSAAQAEASAALAIAPTAEQIAAVLADPTSEASMGQLATMAAKLDAAKVGAADGAGSLDGAGRQPEAEVPTRLTASVLSAAITLAAASEVAAVVGSAPVTLDTLGELGAALGDDPNFATTVATSLGNRVRFDAAQVLTAEQQAQAADNIGAATVIQIGDTTKAIDKAFASAAIAIPGSRGSGNVSTTEKSKLIGEGGYNAFPGLALCPDGSLVVAWRKGGTHVDKGAMYQSRSLDLGRTWTTPVIIVSDPVLDVRDVMLSTLRDGRIAMFYFVYNGTHPTGSYVRFSTDNAYTWGAAITVTFTTTYMQAATGPVLELPNGDLLVSAYTANSANTITEIKVKRSVDGGTTWGDEVTAASSATGALQFYEPVMGILPNGGLMMLIRTGNNGVAETRKSTSADNGITWTTPVVTLPASSGRPGWIALKSGGVVFSYRRTAGSDWKHEFITSWDNAATWSAPARLGLELSSQSVYSQMVELAPGLIGIAYADETNTTTASVRFKYLVDGSGVTPFGEGVNFGPEKVFIPASAISSYAGATSAMMPGVANVLVWLMDASAVEGLAVPIGLIPAGWNSYDVNVIWAPTSAAAGGVVFQVISTWFDPGVLPSVNAGQASVTSAAGGATAAVQGALAATRIPRKGLPAQVRLLRIATDVADTYAADIGIFGVEVVRSA